MPDIKYSGGIADILAQGAPTKIKTVNTIGCTPDEMDAILERRIRFVADAWGHASAYDTAITIAGYGAFFALWSGVSGDITPVARTATAAMLGTSVTLYISWVILVMLARHSYDRELQRVMAAPQSAIDQIAAWDAVEARKNATVTWIQHRFWMPVFGFAVALGLGGGLTLSYNALAVAIGLPQLTGRF